MKPVPRTYQATNWKAYNAALKVRGPLLIWLDPAMNWHGATNGRRGRSPTFSDEAIQLAAMPSHGHDAKLAAINRPYLARP